MTPRRVLVTGGTGFLGPHVCRRLQAAGAAVTVLVHRRDGALPAGVERVSGDLLEPGSLDAACAAAGSLAAIVHLATEPPGAGPRSGVNVAGTAHLLAAARARGVPRLVYTSTMSVYDFLDPELPMPVPETCPPAPRDAYGREKLEAEGLCLQAAAAGGPVVPVLRLAGVYGPGKAAGAAHNFLRAAAAGQPIDIASDRRVDLLWVEDAAAAVVRALEQDVPAGCCHVGSGRALALSQLAAAAGVAAGRSTAVRVAGPGNAFCLDIARARRALGFEPTPLATALARFHRHLSAGPETP